MSTQAEPSWLVVAPHPQLQPIRLPADAFERLHRETAEGLERFVAEHRERFPQRLSEAASSR